MRSAGAAEDAALATGVAGASIRAFAARSVACASIGTGGCSTVTGVSAPEDGSCEATGGAESRAGMGSGTLDEVVFAAATASREDDRAGNGEG